jgi:hypothetical protein
LLVGVAVSQPAGVQILKRRTVEAEADERLARVTIELGEKIVPLHGACRIGDELVPGDEPSAQQKGVGADSFGDVRVVVVGSHKACPSLRWLLVKRVEEFFTAQADPAVTGNLLGPRLPVRAARLFCWHIAPFSELRIDEALDGRLGWRLDRLDAGVE